MQTSDQVFLQPVLHGEGVLAEYVRIEHVRRQNASANAGRVRAEVSVNGVGVQSFEGGRLGAAVASLQDRLRQEQLAGSVVQILLVFTVLLVGRSKVVLVLVPRLLAEIQRVHGQVQRAVLAGGLRLVQFLQVHWTRLYSLVRF